MCRPCVALLQGPGAPHQFAVQSFILLCKLILLNTFCTSMFLIN
ncbi:hypothetical protein LINPERPRIM_LOCUS1536 [Linum perenne]